MSENKKNYSIHPRNWYKVDSEFVRGKKTNTSKSRTPVNTTAHAAHTAVHTRDAASIAHLHKRMAQ